MGMPEVADLLRGVGLGYRFDSDGDITFTMRLPGESYLPEDGSPDWSYLRYSLQPDFSISGEFTQRNPTDLAKRIIRFYLIGKNMRAGVLGMHAYPRVVPAKFRTSAHIAVVPSREEVDKFNRSGETNLKATLFRDQSFALTAGISGELSADALRGVIGYAQHTASTFVEGRFQGWFVAEPA